MSATGEKVLSIRITFRADGTPVIQGSTAAINALAQATGLATQQSAGLASSNSHLTASLANLSSQVQRLTNLNLAQTRIAAQQITQQQQQTVVLTQTNAAIMNLGAAVNNYAQRARAAAATTNQTTSALASLKETVSGIGAAFQWLIGIWASMTILRKIIDEFKELTMAGVEFNSELQQSKLSLGALIVTFANVYDAQGRLLKGNDAYNESMRIGADLQNILKQRALSTTLQYSELLAVLQRGMPYMLQHFADKNGFIPSNEQLVDFTATFAQGAKSFGLQPEEIGTNIQRLLAGTADPRHARFAAAILQSIAPDQAAAKQQMKDWEAQGVLLEKLTEKLAAFKQVGVDAMDTYDGALSNLKDHWQQLLGIATEGATKSLTDSILEVRGAIASVDEKGHVTFNPDFVERIGTVADAIAKVVSVCADLIAAIPEIGIEFHATWLSMTNDARNKAALLSAITNLDAGKPGAAIQLGAAIAQGETGPQTAYEWEQIVRQRERDARFRDQNKQMMQAWFSGGHDQPMGPGKLKKKGGGGTDDEEFDSAASDFKKWMKQFEIGAIPTNGDAVAKALQQIETQREEAIEHLNKSRAKLGLSNAAWKHDLDLINATFDNKRSDELSKVAEEVAKFADSMEKYNRGYKGSSDPLEEALNQNTDQMNKALQSLDAFHQKFGSVVMADWDGLAAKIKEFYGEKSVDIADKSLDEINKRTLENAKRNWDMQEQMAIERQTSIEDARIALITNSIDRELAAQLEANQRWAAEERKKIDLQKETDAERKKDLDVLQKWLDQKNAQAEEKARIARAKQKAGTAEWIADLKQKIDEAFPPIGVTIEDTIVSSLQAATGAVDEFFSHLIDGQKDVGKQLEDLGKNFGKMWSKVFSDMLVNAATGKQSLLSQWQQINAAMNSSKINAALGGAGIGAFIGGIVGGPGNYGAVGGTVGGIAGGIIGSIYGNPALGAAIGAAIGSAIGALIKTGAGNYIKVAIQQATLGELRGGGNRLFTGDPGHHQKIDLGGGAFFDISQQGLSADSFNDLVVQVQRKVKETMKSYESIIKLFPDEIQKALANFNPALTITGGVEGGKEIGDTSGMQELNDFLTNKVNAAAFAAYKPAFEKALSLEGDSSDVINQLFAYWGTLQGQELHDAVANYVKTLVSFVDIKGKITGGFTNALLDATNRENKTPFQSLQEITGQIGLVVASIPKLTDVEDKTAAMDQLNTLSTQWYENMVGYLEQLDQLAQRIHDQLQGTREQIQLAGMSDQGKMDYYYAQINTIRATLKSATDPKQIEELVNRANTYIQQAFGLAPDNAENRQKLIDILNEIEGMSNDDIAKAKDAVADEQTKAATMLQQAATALMGAADKINPPATNPNPGGGNGGPDKPLPDDPTANAMYTLNASVQSATASLDALTAAIKENGAGSASSAARDEQFFTRMVTALRSAKIEATDSVPIIVDNGDLGRSVEARVTRNLRITFATDPDFGTPRFS